MDELRTWGWDDGWTAAWEAAKADGLTARVPARLPARVVAQHRERWQLVAEAGDVPAVLGGRLRSRAGRNAFPVVGDWVGYLPGPGGGLSPIDLVLPRRSAFERRVTGRRVGAQTIAANVDVLLVATSLDRDLNERRLERYVAMGRESGAEPVVVLTKADLQPAADRSPVAGRLAADLGVAVVTLSAASGAGLDALGELLVPGRTVALVGSSGVGKSTLLNRLAGAELMATREVRANDARGRHTTTHRELFRLPGGALLLDTPGMRELGLWDAAEGVESAFSEIGELAARCRFRDCRHGAEPGCEVRQAVRDGRLDERRLRAYERLGAELAGQPTFAERLATDRAFRRVIRDAAEASEARKSYRER